MMQQKWRITYTIGSKKYGYECALAEDAAYHSNELVRLNANLDKFKHHDNIANYKGVRIESVKQILMKKGDTIRESPFEIE